MDWNVGNVCSIFGWLSKLFVHVTCTVFALWPFVNLGDEACLAWQLYLVLFQRGIILTVYDDRPIWMQSYFPFIVAGASILTVFVLGFVVRTHCSCPVHLPNKILVCCASTSLQNLFLLLKKCIHFSEQSCMTSRVYILEVTPELTSLILVETTLKGMVKFSIESNVTVPVDC